MDVTDASVVTEDYNEYSKRDGSSLSTNNTFPRHIVCWRKKEE